MTVSSSLARVSASGNGATTAFSTSPMIFFDASTLVVTLVNDSTGVETVQTITTDYTVVGGSGAVGTVNMITAPASGETLVIERVEPNTQALDLEFQSRIPSPSLETALDKIVLQIQRVISNFDFALNAAQTAYDAVSRKISNLAPGTAGTDAVNKDQLDAVVAAAGNVPTPDNPGEDDYFLKASGGTFDWEAPVDAREILKTYRGSVTVSSANRSQLFDDEGKIIRFETGASDRTYDLAAVATVERGYTVVVQKADDGAGKVIIDPSGSETVEEFSTFELAHKGDTVIIQSIGSGPWRIMAAYLKPVTTVHTSSTTHTYTVGRRKVKYKIQSGGGSSGGTAATGGSDHASSGGGGGGEYFEGVTDIPGSSSTITVGTGGAAPAAGNNNGNAVGASAVVGVAGTVGGGGGNGGANTASAAFSDGGSGGTGGTTTATFDWARRIAGQPGGAGRVIGGQLTAGNTGGHSHTGPGGEIQLPGAGQTPGNGFGGGGGGSNSFISTGVRAGAAGDDGFIEVEEYY